MLISLKDLMSKLASPSYPMIEGMHCMKSNSFTLHHYQTLSNMVFVINTDPSVPGKPVYYLVVRNSFNVINDRYVLQFAIYLQ